MVFIPNPNFEEEIAPEVAVGLAAEVDQAKMFAQSFAPVAEGNYRDGIKVVIQDGQVYLVGFDWKSIFIEYGTSVPGPTPAFAPLRRGIIAAGYEFEDTRET